METTCPHCSQTIEIDEDALESLRGAPSFDCPTCAGPVPSPVPPDARRGSATTKPANARRSRASSFLGMNRNLRLLGGLALLVLGGLAIFIAGRNTGTSVNARQNVVNQVINNEYFSKLIASGVTSISELAALEKILPHEEGFIGISKDKRNWVDTVALAAKTGAEILDVESLAAGKRKEFTAWLKSSFPWQHGQTVWVRDNGATKVIDSPDVLNVTTMDRPRLAFLSWPSSDSTRIQVDPNFKPNVDGKVYNLIVQKDGKFLIRGDFTAVDGVPRPGFARLNPDGTLDRSFELDTALLSKVGTHYTRVRIVSAVARDDGSLIVAQDNLVRQEDRSTGNLASLRWLRANGSVVPGVGMQLEREIPKYWSNSPVMGLEALPDGKLLVIGDFTSAGGVPRNGIARLHADGTLDTSFNARVERGTDPDRLWRVGSVAIQSDGKIVIGGYFTAVEGVPQAGIARLNADGTLDPRFNANNNIYMKILKIDGESFGFRPPLDPSILGKPFPHKLLGAEGVSLQADGKIVFHPELRSEKFMATGGGNSVQRTYITRLNADGSLDPSLNPDLPSARAVPLPDGRTIIMGDFRKVGAVDIARFNADGSLDKDFDFKVDGWVGFVKPLPDGSLLLGGGFTTILGVPSKHMARIKIGRK